MNLNVGIDVGKSKLSYCGIATNSPVKPVVQGEVSNSHAGAEQIKTVILKWATEQTKGSVEQIIIGLEATSIYHYHVMMYFMDDEDLQEFNTLTVCLNPKYTHKYSQMFDQDKTDRIDAHHIAQQLMSGLFRDSLNRSEEYLALQRLTRERTNLGREMTQAKNHYLNNLYLKLNTADTTISSSMFSKTMLELLSGDNYSLSALKAMTLSQLTKAIKESSKQSMDDSERTAKEVKKSIKSSFSLNRTVADSVDLTLGIYYRQIRMYTTQIKALEVAIKQLAETLPAIQCLMSIPGIGSTYAAGLVAEIGEPDRFPSEAHLAKYAGLSWHRNQSGNYDQEEKHRVKSGDQYLRSYLVEAADSVRQRDPVFAAYYAKKYKEVNNHQHQRALSLPILQCPPCSSRQLLLK
jgi:transposase